MNWVEIVRVIDTKVFNKIQRHLKEVEKIVLHRDIKQSNVMVRPDGKLILIDFGTARRLTTTYVEKLPEADITKIYSDGYTPPEQRRGQAMVQSDLFAIGRTFVHLMTGVYPENLLKTTTNRLIWHRSASQISSSLKDLIDRLLVLCPEQRPNASEIVNLLEQIKEQDVDPRMYRNYRLKSWQRSAAIILLSSIAIACLITGIRYLGWLQPLELSTYDRLMQLRPLENSDSRLLWRVAE